MKIFIVLGFDSVRLSTGVYKHELMGVRAAKTEKSAQDIVDSAWGQQFTFTEIEERETE